MRETGTVMAAAAHDPKQLESLTPQKKEESESGGFVTEKWW